MPSQKSLIIQSIKCLYHLKSMFTGDGNEE